MEAVRYNGVFNQGLLIKLRDAESKLAYPTLTDLRGCPGDNATS